MSKKWKVRYRGDVDEEKNTLPTEYRTPTYKDLRRELGINTFGQRLYNDDHLLKKYEDRFVKWDFVDGKKVRIDTRISDTHVYNPNETRKYINLNKYGTETPLEDFRYLDLEQKIERSEKVGPNPIRKILSREKLGGGKIVEAEHQAHVDERKKELEILKNRASNKVVETTEKEEKTPKVPNLFKSKQLDLTEIKDPQNRQIAKEIHDETEKQKKIILGNILK
tara:strand:+ start:64 stop:732 length:669 start_codon:yes stop_codon:yes gene_type:complete